MSDMEKEVFDKPLTDNSISEAPKAAASTGETTGPEAEALNDVPKTEKPMKKTVQGTGKTPVKRKKPVRPEGAVKPEGEHPVRKPRPEGTAKPADEGTTRKPRLEGAKKPAGEGTVRKPRPEGAQKPAGEGTVRKVRPEGAQKPAGEGAVRRVRPEGAQKPAGEGTVRKPRPEGAVKPEGDRSVRRPRPEGEDLPVRRPRPEGEDRPVRREGDRPARRPERDYRDAEDRAWDDWAEEKKRKEENRKKRKKVWKVTRIVLLILASLLFLFLIGTLAVNGYMLLVERRKVVTSEVWAEKLRDGETTDCILVLGCSVVNQKPSADLKGRLDKTVELYKLSPHKILVSGDHSADGYYNEVNVMKDYLVEKGIPSSDIFLDHYGFSTYDSIYRAYHTFGVRKVTIVTQDFHIYRSVFLARSIGMETIGVASVDKAGGGESVWNLREVFARDKDFLASLFWPDPERTGDDIPLTGNGDDTNVRGK